MNQLQPAPSMLAPQRPLAAAPGASTPTPAPAIGTTGAGMTAQQTPPISSDMQAAFTQNQQWLAEGDHTYNTQLTPQQEQQFRQWLTQQPQTDFNPSATVNDYDMRGFWKALQAGDPKATTEWNDNTKSKHYPDYWKTPYHRSFSSESQWAGKNAPRWNKKDQLVTPDGKVVFDEPAWAAKQKQ